MLEQLTGHPDASTLVRRWWTTSSDYAGHVDYFAKRSLARSIQVIIGLCAAVLAAIPLIIQLSPAGPTGVVARAISTVVAATTITWALIWWFRPWPSQRASTVFIINSDIAITTVTALDSNRLAGMFGLNALTLVSVYIMFFHGPKCLALHTLWAMLSIAFFAVVITVEHHDPMLAVAKTLAAVASMVLTPLAIQFGIWVLRNEANEAIIDQLTGVLNRRGLDRLLGEFLTGNKPGSAVTVMVIDLDRFKQINDTYGHTVGDEVLTRSARRILSAVRTGALVARLGGEEFAVVDLYAPSHAQAIAERVRNAIGAPADQAPVTASIGVSSQEADAFTGQPDPVAVLHQMIEDADHAMFEAKRAGGDRVRLSQY